MSKVISSFRFPVSARALPLCFALFVLAACGFEPVLAKRAPAASSQQVYLPEVRIETDRSHLGQLLKAEIEDQINPRHDAPAKRYVLKITVSDTLIPLFINPDGTASRGEILYDSRYTLTRLTDNVQIASGTITRASSFNSSETADYATYAAQEDAKRRGIVELSKDYALRLANVKLESR